MRRDRMFIGIKIVDAKPAQPAKAAPFVPVEAADGSNELKAAPRLAPALERKFRRAVQNLNEVLTAVRKDVPDANYYLAMEDLNLLSGASHDRSGGSARHDVPRQDRIMASATLWHSGGGDW